MRWFFHWPKLSLIFRLTNEKKPSVAALKMLFFFLPSGVCLGRGSDHIVHAEANACPYFWICIQPGVCVCVCGGQFYIKSVVVGKQLGSSSKRERDDVSSQKWMMLPKRIEFTKDLFVSAVTASAIALRMLTSFKYFRYQYIRIFSNWASNIHFPTHFLKKKAYLDFVKASSACLKLQFHCISYITNRK